MLIVPQDRDAITLMLTWCEAGRVSILAKECCRRTQETSVCGVETQPCASGVPQQDPERRRRSEFGGRRKMLVAMYVQWDRGER